MGCDNNEKDFILAIMLVLGVCLCVIAFFCGGEIMMKVPMWTKKGICIATLLISLGVCILFFCFGISSICHSVNCCKKIKISEKEYFVLTKENVNDKGDFKYRKKILAHKDVDEIPPCTFSCNYNLEKIEFYGKVQIHEAAFFGCTNLTEVVFHNNVICIGDDAFAGCKKLETIKYDGKKEDWKKIIFGNNWNKDVPAMGVTCIDGTENFDSDNSSDDGKTSDKISQ